MAGYEAAEYIPSWREQQQAEEGSSVEGDSEGGGSGGADESSDEESLKAFRDLFDAGQAAHGLVK